MIMKSLAFALPMLLALSASAAGIGRQVVRQQWPWSSDVTVEYELTNVTEAVDIEVRFFENETALETPDFHNCVSGVLHGVRASGLHTFTFDPLALFGTAQKRIRDLRIELTPVTATPNLDEVIYRIVDLEHPGITDVTRGEILNGKYGSYETDFGRIGPGFRTSLADVLIWTGVTNNPEYKTTKYVLRKIPAAGKHFMMGQNDSAINGGAGVDTSFSHDFWIGVFEVTQRQHEFFRYVPGAGHATPDIGWETNGLYAAQRASDYTCYEYVRSYTTKDWPECSLEEAYAFRYFGNLRRTYANYFGADHPLKWLDLPTEAQWEFACRAGTTAEIYSGKEMSDANLAEVGRFLYINCRSHLEIPDPTSSSYPDRGCGLDYGVTIPGQYRPNAYGLYDMEGNALEICLDQWGTTLPGGEDPVGGPIPASGRRHVVRGGCYYWSGPDWGGCHSRYSEAGYQINGFRMCLHTHNLGEKKETEE